MLDRRALLLGLGGSLASPFVQPSWAATPGFKFALRPQRLWIPSQGNVAGNGVNPTVLALSDGRFYASAVSMNSGTTFVQTHDANGKLQRRRALRRTGEFGNTLIAQSTIPEQIVLLSASVNGLSGIDLFSESGRRWGSRIGIVRNGPAFYPVSRSVNEQFDIFVVRGPLVGGQKFVERYSYKSDAVNAVDGWNAGTSGRPEVNLLAVSGSHLLSVEYNGDRTDFGYEVRKLSSSDAIPVLSRTFLGKDVPRSGLGLASIAGGTTFALAWSAGGRLQGSVHDDSGAVKVQLKPVADPGRIVPESPLTTPMVMTGDRIIAFSRTGSVVAWNLTGQVVAGPTRLDIGSPVEARPLSAGRVLVASTDKTGGKSYVSIVSLG
jgi:hypothetical protein